MENVQIKLVEDDLTLSSSLRSVVFPVNFFDKHEQNLLI